MPTDKAVVVSVAVAVDPETVSGTVVSGAPPSVKVIWPVGVGDTPGGAVTVAVSVSPWPEVIAALEAAMEMVGAARSTVSATVGDGALAPKPPSPS